MTAECLFNDFDLDVERILFVSLLTTGLDWISRFHDPRSDPIPESRLRRVILLQSLFRHNTCGASPERDLDMFCVVSLYRNNVNSGLVVGNIHAARRLVILNTSDVHFDPCLLR